MPGSPSGIIPKTPLMTPYKPGQIVLVPFPFTDLSTTKKRPALILTQAQTGPLPALFVVAMITSQVEGARLPGDYQLQDWQISGLLHPSKVRLAKVVSLEKGFLEKSLGTLSPRDRRGVKAAFQSLYPDWA